MTAASGPEIIALAAIADELESLALHGAFLSTHELAALLAVPQLEEIDVAGLPVSPAVLDQLVKGFPALRVVIIGLANRAAGHRFTPAAISPAVLGSLAPLTRLDRLGLRGIGIGDGDIPRIPCLHRVSWLDLGETQVTGDGLAELAPAEFLRHLWLDDCRIGNAGAEHLARIQPLESLDVSFAGVGDAGIAALARLPRLERLGLGGSTINIAGVRSLGEFPRLRDLDLSSTTLSSGGLTELVERVPLLRELRMSRARLTAAEVSKLHTLHNLRSLRLGIDGSESTWGGLSALPGLVELRAPGLPAGELRLPPMLTEISIGSAPQAVQRLFEHAPLEVLQLRGGGEAFALLQHQQLPRLRELLVPSGLDDEGLTRLARLPNLQALYVSDNRLTDGGVARLDGAQHLHTLELRRTGIGDATCPVLARLPALHCLDVPGTMVTERGVSVLADAPNLQSLAVDGTQLTDFSADALARAPNLVEIYLYYHEVTGATIARLAPLPKLSELNLFEVDLQRDSVDAIALLPNLRIVRLAGSYPADFEDALRMARPDLVLNGVRNSGPAPSGRRHL